MTFSTKLEFDEIEFNAASIDDIVRFSFIVQHSLAYLNLDLCEYSNAGKNYRSVLNIANEFVNTEEKCRKILKPNRSLLYTLHLDIPAGREHSLKNVPPSSYEFSFESQHIARISVPEDSFYFILSRLIECAFKSTVQPLKLLSLLQKYQFLKTSFYRINSDDLNTIIGFFYPKICDTLLFKSFLEVVNLEYWMYGHDEPEILDFLLYHACLYEIDIKKQFDDMSLVVDNCITHCVFLNIKSWLKYADTSRYSLSAYGSRVNGIKCIRPDFSKRILKKAKRLLDKQRINLIMQIFLAYIDCNEHGCIAAASDAFRLLWNSYPDPFICLEEISLAFTGAFSEEDISGSFEFYCNSIGKIPSCVEPRTLQQLCRTTIRRTIKENKFWIPKGVELTGLPKRLQAFLNLEEVIPQPDCSRS